MRLSELLEFLGSDCRALKEAGTPVELAAPAPLDSAGPGSIAFCGRTAKDPNRALETTLASVVICDESMDLTSGIANPAIATIIVSRNARLDFMRVMKRFFTEPIAPGIHSSAIVHPTARIGAGVHIGPLCSLSERVSVGDYSVLHAGVHLYHGVIIGDRVTINSGTVVGADGFGYERNEEGRLERFPHVGSVVIENDVEIGANTCIDRGTLGDTRILSGARIDNLVHIAHNVIVGRDAAVIADAMVGGGTTIGDGAWIAPSAVLRDRLTVGAGSTVGMAADVTKDVPENAVVMGSPARAADEFKAIQEFVSHAALQHHAPEKPPR